MKVTVTKSNINDGLRCNGKFCPTALALKEAVPGVDWCVTWKHIKILTSAGDIDKSIKSPQSVYEFIYKYDGNEAVEPFEFEIDYVE